MSFFKFHPKERDIDEFLQSNMQEVLAQLYAKNKRLFLAVCIGFFAGTRISETSSLHWDDIDLTAKTIHIKRRAWNRKGTKGQKKGRPIRQRIVPLPIALGKVLCALFRTEGGWLFPNYDTGKHITKETLSRELQAFCSDKEYSFTFHDLRHLFASRANGSIAMLAKLLGHSDVKCTLIYTHFDLEKEGGKSDEEKNRKWHSEKYKKTPKESSSKKRKTEDTRNGD